MLFDFGTALVFFIVGAAFIGITLLISRLLQPRNPTAAKMSTYECGEQPIGESWIQFNNRFYVIALIFLIFDVEIAVLFPWAAVFKQLNQYGAFAFVEMAVFVSILLFGLAYVWRKGDLEWDKPETGQYARARSPELYEELPPPGIVPAGAKESVSEPA
ncbi:MAG: NAD(P)H-quinone oxidoreductase subunit 3, chloroplastic [bacterium]|nr:NAD(P)H-quinone oxidoreductase subunit 3, chloroplastic [bacterium]